MLFTQKVGIFMKKQARIVNQATLVYNTQIRNISS